MERVYAFLKDNINDVYVVIGVSGGVDSMVLLSIIKNHISSKIVCAHVHHNLRVESDSELEFVKEYCSNNGIICENSLCSANIKLAVRNWLLVIVIFNVSCEFAE